MVFGSGSTADTLNLPIATPRHEMFTGMSSATRSKNHVESTDPRKTTKVLHFSEMHVSDTANIRNSPYILMLPIVLGPTWSPGGTTLYGSKESEFIRIDSQ